MTDVTHVVDAVQVGVVVVVKHVLALSAYNLERVLLEEQLARGTDVLLSQRSSSVPAGHWNLAEKNTRLKLYLFKMSLDYKGYFAHLVSPLTAIIQLSRFLALFRQDVAKSGERSCTSLSLLSVHCALYPAHFRFFNFRYCT